MQEGLFVRRFFTTLVISLTILFCMTMLELAPAEGQPYKIMKRDNIIAVSKDSSDSTTSDNSSITHSAKLTRLYSFVTGDNTNIEIVSNGDNIYITGNAPQTMKSDKFSEVKPSSVSSKILVNAENSLKKGYIPESLTKINPKKVKLQYPELKLIPMTLKALYSMIDTAKKNKIDGFIINSAYRSETTQQQIFNANLNTFRKSSKTYKEAYKKTRNLVALPGNSEHRTGLAVDIFSIDGRHRSDFVGTKEQVWLNKNLYLYGFIIRYPADKTEITNSTYEPWHIRYAGIPLSCYLYEKNLCLEEFYNKIFKGNILENKTHLFLQIKSNQKVYTDKNMLSQTELESVKDGVLLLTVKKN